MDLEKLGMLQTQKRNIASKKITHSSIVEESSQLKENDDVKLYLLFIRRFSLKERHYGVHYNGSLSVWVTMRSREVLIGIVVDIC